MAGDREDRTVPDTPSATVAQRRAVQVPSRYRLGEVIGEGGMGRVYRAHDATLGRDVAVKVLEMELRGKDRVLQCERFVREARTAARLVHPNIVAVHDVDPDAGWLVMALVEGMSLRDLPPPLSVELVHAVARQLLSALAAAHAAGVVHRDIKPSNIIVDLATRHATLIDFGVARLSDAELTQTGESLGTPAYMAPEQMRGATIDARTDLYGLGATLYELVVGDRIVAFESPNERSLTRLRKACGADASLAVLIEACLQADPEDRPSSASAALDALEGRPAPRVAPAPTVPERPVARRAESAPPPVEPPRPAPAATPEASRRWPLVALALLILAMGVAAAAYLWTRPGPEDPRIAQAFTLAQRGEHERAGQILEDYLGTSPRDPDALALRVLTGWWDGSSVSELLRRAVDAPLSRVQRAMIHTIDLSIQRRESEAAAYLESLPPDVARAPELIYMRGEMLWHSQRIAAGAETLERAFAADPRWQMALHHVIEYHLTRGHPELMTPIAERLRAVDPIAAESLECRIAIGRRDYERAVAIAVAARQREPIPELEICLAQARTLAGDLAEGHAVAKLALDKWPIDTREWGGFATYAEHFLYRGQLEEYLAFVRGKPSRQRTLALALWQPSRDKDLSEPAPAAAPRTPPPLGAALWILLGWTHKRDEVGVYETYPEQEVRLYGRGLWAETRDHLDDAIASYRAALDVPAKGDIHMLVSHHLARALRTRGDLSGAARACDGVLRPRVYHTYRAVLLPDCMLWSEDPVQWKRLVDAWAHSSFEHPSVVEARRRLASR